MSRGAFQIIIAAMIAGAIGFGIAICAVPLEEIVQFRALVNAGRGAISTKFRRDNGETRLEHATAPSSTEPAAAPGDIPERDRATQNPPGGGSAAPQAPAPENEAAKLPSLAPHGESEKTQGAPADQSKRPAKKARSRSSPAGNPRN